MIVDAISILPHVMQIKNEITKHGNLKIIKSAKTIIVGILADAFVRIASI